MQHGSDGWQQRMSNALAAGECTTQREWVKKYPGAHCWFTFDLTREWESCANCGVVRRLDDKNKPCKGVVGIKPR